MTGVVNQSALGPWLAASWAVLCFAGSAGAMDPNRTLSQYTRDRWTVDQGFPGGTVYAIAGTPDGYLWIGAEKGLVRFDGLNFRLFNHSNSATLPAGPVLDLAASPDGDLWIRMQSPSVLRYRDGVFQDVSQTLFRSARPITTMFRRENGELLFTTIANTTLNYTGGKVTERRFQTEHPNFFVVAVSETNDHRIWLGTRDSGLFSLSEGDAIPVAQGLDDRRINCLLPAGKTKGFGSAPIQASFAGTGRKSLTSVSRNLSNEFRS